ncbi:inorganic diphosphatase [Photobacterium aquimaris]|uniref:inorganic diphosphatase n=1 Tax=Photobacterium aquimaris TaxID=512643 RepID=A0A2T3IIJ8_9GAMM|nr:inorganic diphosphatase [Photobacterium aquimaris]OBU15776.1 inorganic diphosphatase [Photobacterium aquimaris]PSU28168.1 inorganic diphosphatase [Photobacterium aquimaris]
MKKHLFLISLLINCTSVFAIPNVSKIDTYTIKADQDYLAATPAKNQNGTINAIIEIPTGSNEKWEVSKVDGSVINWEFKNGQPRIVHYLGYPSNYGTIPHTSLPKSLGGDGDPLDVLVLGSAMVQGSIVQVRLIGGLKMLDDGEQDDKLLAVPISEQSPFKKITSIKELQQYFPGVLAIIETWFSNYKGSDAKVVIQGSLSKQEALNVLDKAIKYYKLD